MRNLLINRLSLKNIAMKIWLLRNLVRKYNVYKCLFLPSHPCKLLAGVQCFCKWFHLGIPFEANEFSTIRSIQTQKDQFLPDLLRYSCNLSFEKWVWPCPFLSISLWRSPIRDESWSFALSKATRPKRSSVQHQPTAQHAPTTRSGSFVRIYVKNTNCSDF